MTQPVSILVVDDDKDVTDSIALVLREEGFRVHSASCGVDALSLVDAHLIDVAIVDYHMPGVVVSELVAELRARAGPRLGIILCTGGDAASLAGDSGVDLMLQKPFTIEDLLTVVRRASGQTQEQEQEQAQAPVDAP